MRGLRGCVDGIIEGELRGWLINLDDPSRTEPVVCRDIDGREQSFTPFVFRDDVNAAMDLSGVFGFAIPVDLLAPLNRVISVCGRNGVPLENGTSVTVPSASTAPRMATASRSGLTIFLHISKTAGTSLRNTLMRTVPPGELLLIYPGATPGLSLAKSHRVTLPQRDRLRWVFGHVKFGFDRHVTQPCRYVTFIREPMERLRSNFAHHAAYGTEFELGGIRVSPATVLNDGLSEEFDNVMTRVLTGFGHDVVPLGEMGADEVNLALANVRRHFSFVGRHSQADEDTAIMQDHFGLPAFPLTVDNVTPETRQYGAAEMAAVDWNRVAAKNNADLLLYSRLEQESLVSRVLD